ncbi:hypothetical protein POV27_15300 [Aureisphaera galaxeae]|uniref:hypothetical protein n=1 Tax=Aureisphaera galaxeae TaxID=1538023 RepID=UPI00234FC43C|nr:hypothetical protein [Aureisphaera galaxeae]MDC8005429.1 hypothetical protein [Aureisphaera galaxeae]
MKNPFEFPHRHKREIATFLLCTFLFSLFAPTSSFALTSGPADPTTAPSSPLGSDDMVDLFTGDFKYSVPLFELPGPNGVYPFTANYNSDVNMDKEASWVGLGWSMNPGAISRSVQGIPDDWSVTDNIRYVNRMKPQQTTTIELSPDAEIFGAAFKEFSKKTGPLQGASLNISYSNYTGFDLSVGANLSFAKQGKPGFDTGISFSPKNGLSISPSLNIDDKYKKNAYGRYSLGLSLNSNYGINNLGLSYSVERQDADGNSSRTGVGSSNFSFNPVNYTPFKKNAYESFGFSYKFKFGIDFWGMKGDLITNGSYHEQVLDTDDRVNAKGYLYSHHANNEDVMDFNRQGVSILNKSSQNLPVPKATNDFYQVSTAFTSGTFRPFSNNVGVYSDPHVDNFGVTGENIGIDATPPSGAGTNLSFDMSSFETGQWLEDNSFDDNNNFEQNIPGQLKENVFFKYVHEKSVQRVDILNDIGGESPTKINLGPLGVAQNQTTNKDGSPSSIESFRNPLRTPRKSNINYFTNSELLGNRTTVVLPEFAYLDNGANDIRFTQKSVYKGHHIGGFEILSEDGTRNIFGLPVYNHKHIEQQFSVKRDTTLPQILVNYPLNADGHPDEKKASEGIRTNSQDYFSRTEKSPYAYTYLLTCVLGADYVDSDDIPGPSNGDKGYWVKFNYEQKHSASNSNGLSGYKWRTPHSGAYYSAGHHVDLPMDDDMASYSYGERDTFILVSAETRSHTAVFHTTDRHDARGVSGEHNFGPSKNEAYSSKLDSIQIFSKLLICEGSDPINTIVRPGHGDESNASETSPCLSMPEKTIHFEYDYILCKNVPNNENPDLQNTGKLTLKKIWFTYKNNKRGEDNSYLFSYNNSSRYNYDVRHKDGWGNFKMGGNYKELVEFPVVQQYDVNNIPIDKKNDASAWMMREITTPNSGKIKIDYEPKDYAYVHDRRASQLFKIFSVDETLSPQISPNEKIDKHKRTVYFKLEEPFNTNDVQKFKSKYLSDLNMDNEGQKQVHFKTFMSLSDTRVASELNDFVTGYASIEKDSSGEPICGLAKSQGSSNYDLGYITLAYPKVGGDEMEYHPFSFAVYQLRRNELAQLPLFPQSNTMSTTYSGQSNDILNVVNSIVTRLPNIFSFFRSYYSKCEEKGWGNVIDLNYSYVSLNTPDWVKTGGGARVVSVVVSDNWNTLSGETTAEIGTVYDYYKRDEKENIIRSAGVAANEPLPMRVENNLYTTKYSALKRFLHTANRMSFEYPINMGYFPGNTIGHSQVTVKTLATHRGQSKTGYAVHEFFTTKDFPFFSEETSIERWRPFPILTPVPLIGNLEIRKIGFSQGYCVQTNNMHGVLKKIAHYKSYSNCLLEKEPSSYVKYNYAFKHKSVWDQAKHTSKTIKVLDNVAPVILDDPTAFSAQLAEKTNKLIGVDYELFSDMNRTQTKSEQYGIHGNLDAFGLFPVVTPWPTVMYNKSEIRTAVLNKIISRQGILTSIEALDNNSYVKTENLAFDEYTAEPLLTKVNDAYDEARYQYNLPARWTYDGMGNASLTTRVQLEVAHDNTKSFLGEYVYTFDLGNTSGSVKGLLRGGDEFICYESGVSTPYKGYYVPNCDKNQIDIYFPDNPTINPQSDWTFLLSRSGRRNHLGATTATYQTKKDPTVNRTVSTCSYAECPCGAPSEIGPVHACSIYYSVAHLGEVVSLQGNTFTEYALPLDTRWDLVDPCLNCPLPNPPLEINGLVNPLKPSRYYTGDQGIWRSHRNYRYMAYRTYTNLGTGQGILGLQNQGLMNDVPMFNAALSEKFIACNPDWKRTSEITRFDRYSNPIEEKDVFDKYSSAQYRYAGMKQTAIAYNASYLESYSENFEVRNELPSVLPISEEESHSGKSSLEIMQNGPRSMIIPSDELLPVPGKEYMISCWIKSDASRERFTYYQANKGAFIKIDFLGANQQALAFPVGKKIEGFQKIERSFTIPQNTTGIAITFYAYTPVQNPTGNTTSYFDDLRIHPVDANMNTFVYDIDNYRLLAKLDENNYVTQYIYNEYGQLFSTKVETSDGVKTIQSASSFQTKNH